MRILELTDKVQQQYLGYVSGSISKGVCCLLLYMTSSNGNISTLLALCEGKPLVTGGFSSYRPVMLSFGDFLCLKKVVEQTIEMQVIWNTIVLIITSL